ncbi:hypothetical protein J2X76_001429 [Neorhizobium sp. 2083]|uniref:hypothetical protein n=1 Tax=Neorhizobium sp. 2083 TaxID=2817762 RepID=UPI00285A78E3|nr:hypothetical protein [Neorhizobium sp. 2083]MDR6816275.1 hypothetical protein [Neorhizobium sp. 2083]
MSNEGTGDLKFGLEKPADWLEKARREFRRLQAADGIDKIDHAINTAITIAQVADWCFNDALNRRLIDPGSRNNFISKARKASLDTAILTDIANTSKHYKLDRKPVSTALTVSSGQVIIPREFLFSTFTLPEHEPFREHVTAIRTIIDEDEIIGFHYVVGKQRVLTKDGYVSFEMTCDAAMKFWEASIASIQDKIVPDWLR